MNTEVIAINQDVTPAGRLLWKPADTASSTCALTEQISQANCKLGHTFGCYENNQSMWVAGGCRGKFTCDGASSVECNVMNVQFHVCECKAPAPSPAMIYGRNLTDGSAAVAFYNPNDVDGTGSVDFELLGWAKGTRATVRDLWQHKDLGTVTGRFPAGDDHVAVAAHSTVVLRITPLHDAQIFA